MGSFLRVQRKQPKIEDFIDRSDFYLDLKEWLEVSIAFLEADLEEAKNRLAHIEELIKEGVN